ncbi:MAG: flagellar assembly protein FliW [Spartobacteria bacterium]|nr:flagellar assembly protein FliW [Spartobacteria bacterium]
MKTLVNPYQRNKQSAATDTQAIDPYSRLVALPVQSENIFHFPEGIPAFEDVKEFVFLSKPDSRPFMFMQALNPPDLNFVCIDPFLVHPEYAPRISNADIKALHVVDIHDILVLAIVTINRDVSQTTCNLQGPLVINMQTRVGRQMICDGQNYPVRYNIWDAMDRIERQELDEQKAACAADYM